MAVLVKNGKVRTSGGRVRTGPAGSPCCCGSRQARLCSDDSLQDVWMSQANAATLPGAFSIGSTCYYFDFNDPVSNSPGTIYTPADVTAFDSCEECGDDPCETGGESIPCEQYILRYTRKVENFGETGECVGEPLSTTITTHTETLVVAGIGAGGLVEATGTPWGDPFWNAIDADGERGLGFHCPEGWWLAFSDPANLVICYSTRAAGLIPDGAYPDTEPCCGFDPDPPNTAVRTTYTNITLECDEGI